MFNHQITNLLMKKLILLNLIHVNALGIRSSRIDIPLNSDQSQQAKLDYKPYTCDREENNKLERIFLYQNDFYIILRTEILKFKWPVLKKNIDTNKPFLIINHPVSIKHKLNQLDLIEGQLIGYELTDVDEKGNIVYSIIGTSESEKTGFARKALLDFEEIPGQRVRLSGYVPVPKDNFDFIFILDVIRNRQSTLKMRVIYHDFTMSATFIWKGNQLTREHHFRIGYTVVNAFAYLVESDLNILIIELDDNQIFHFKMLRVDGMFTELDLTKISAFTAEMELSLVNLLNCPQKPSNFDQIQNIFFDSSQQFFYVFIDRFYLKIFDETLIDNNFIFNDDYYDDAKYFKFENQSVLNKIQYKLPLKRSVKKEQFSLFLELSDENIFQIINFGSQKQLVLTDEIEPKYKEKIYQHRNCLNLFEIRKYVFCFQTDHYYLIDYEKNADDKTDLVQSKLSKRTFKELFQNTGLVFEEDLEFIFNYTKNRFVLMTKFYLYVIDYDLVKIDRKKDQVKIYIRYDDKIADKLYKVVNCFLNPLPLSNDFCSRKSIRPISWQPTTKIEKTYPEIITSIKTSKKPDFEPNINELTNKILAIFLIIILIFLLISLVIYCVLNFMRKKHKSRNLFSKIISKFSLISSFRSKRVPDSSTTSSQYSRPSGPKHRKPLFRNRRK